MAQAYSVEGKTALVSGSNRGIGKAVLKELIAQGVAKVYAGSRDVENLADLQSEYGEKIVPVQLDVTDAKSIAAAAEKIGAVDILINNAGVLVPGGATGANSAESLQENLNTNLFGTINVTNSLLDGFVNQGHGAIVNISSVAGLAHVPMVGSYSVSKAAVHNFTQGLRAELMASNISVIGVYPGPIDTDMMAGADLDKESPENVASIIVNGIENGIEDLFPDPVSEEVEKILKESTKQAEQMLSQYSA